MLSVQEMSDRIELGMLLDRYAGAIDRVDMDLLDGVFTPDAEIDYTAFAEFGGIRGSYPRIRQWLGSGLARSPGHQHLVANREIVIDGDHATGRVMCFNPMLLADRTVGFQGLWYVDRYVRTPQGWRIASRHEERSFLHNFPQMEVAA